MSLFKDKLLDIIRIHSNKSKEAEFGVEKILSADFFDKSLQIVDLPCHLINPGVQLDVFAFELFIF